jgi:hypothetical protein
MNRADAPLARLYCFSNGLPGQLECISQGLGTHFHLLAGDVAIRAVIGQACNRDRQRKEIQKFAVATLDGVVVG